MELVFKFKARAPQIVLKELVEDARKHETIEALPRVVLWTRAGTSIEGRALQIGEDKWGGSVLLLTDRGNSPMSTAFVRLDEIIGVDLADAGKYAQVLSEGDVPRPLGQTAPTRLELKRRYADIPARLAGLGLTLETDVEWDKIPDDETAAFNLLDLADALQKAIALSARDAVGKEAWMAVRRVRVSPQVGASLGALREGDLIRVVVDLRKKLPSGLDQALASTLGGTL